MAAVFDGSATELSRSAVLHGVAASKLVTVEGWGRLESDASAAAHYILYGAAASVRFAVYTDSSHKLVVSGYNSSNTEILHLISSAAMTLATWFHFVASASLSAGSAHLYVNGSDVEATGSTTKTDDTLDFGPNATSWYVGSSGSANYWDGRKYDLGFWPGVYVNVSDADYLAGFISSDGVTDTSYEPDATHLNPGPTSGTRKPVGYGVDSSMPTAGVKPAIMFNGPFTANRGTGGAFAVTGTIDQTTGPDIYRQSARFPTFGQRWFDSEKSGFSYPRSQTFIERREGHPAFGRRLGIDERDEQSREDRPSHSFRRLIFGDDETREEEDRR